MSDMLPWLNLLLVPVLGYLMNIDRRITRLETYREAERELGATIEKQRRTNHEKTPHART